MHVIPVPNVIETANRPANDSVVRELPVLIAVSSAASGPVAQSLLDNLRGLGIAAEFSLDQAAATVCLELLPDRPGSETQALPATREGYQLRIAERRPATIISYTPNGLFYGCQTFLQLLDHHEQHNTVALPVAKVGALRVGAKSLWPCCSSTA